MERTRTERECVCLSAAALFGPPNLGFGLDTVLVMCEAGDEDTFLLFSCWKGEQIKRMLMGK